MKKLLIGIVMMLLLASIVFADEDSDLKQIAGITPSSPLYGLSVFLENIQIIITPGDVAKAKLRLDIADERIAEATIEANNNNPDGVKLALDDRNLQIAQVQAVVQSGTITDDKDKEAIRTTMKKSTIVLDTLIQRFQTQNKNPKAIDALQQAKLNTLKSEDKVTEKITAFTKTDQTLESEIRAQIDNQKRAKATPGMTSDIIKKDAFTAIAIGY